MVWRGTPGSGALSIDGNFKVASANNLLIGSSALVNSGQVVAALANVPTQPASLSFDGGIIYCNSGRLYYLGGAGTKTELSATTVPSLAAWNLDTDTNVSTYALTKPTGTVSGEQLRAFVCVRANTTITASGWTSIKEESGLQGSGLSYGLYRKTAGSEPASYNFLGTTAGDYQSVIARFSLAGVNDASAGEEILSGVVSAHTPGITPNKQFALVVGALGGNATETNTAGAPTNPTWTTLANTEQNNVRILFGHLTDGQRATTTISATFLFTNLVPSAAWLIGISED